MFEWHWRLSEPLGFWVCHQPSYVYNRRGEMKKDFSVCNNGLRENQKTKITNLCIGLTVKLKMVYLFFLKKVIWYAKFYYKVQKRHLPIRCVAHLFNDLGKIFCKNPFANMSFNGSSSGWQRNCKPQLTEK